MTTLIGAGRSNASLLEAATAELAEAGVDSPGVDAELLLRHVLGCDRAALALALPSASDPSATSKFADLVALRASRIPLQHIVGSASFRGCELAVDSRALVPRPETETLAQVAIDELRARGGGRILDLCTGGGAVAIAVASEVPDVEVIASDISSDSLDLAQQNARANGVAERIEFVAGDLYRAIGGRPRNSFGLITANPPYVPESDWPNLPPEVRDHDPEVALLGGRDGLDLVRKILAGAPEWLEDGGLIAIEIGNGQAESAAESTPPELESVTVTRDLAGRDRVLTARRRSGP